MYQYPLPTNEFPVLQCAHCVKGDAIWMHQYQVELYERVGGEEDGQCYMIGVNAPDVVFIPITPEANNPSSRRDGMKIYFWCEWCDRDTILEISQHKGQTLFGIEKGAHSRKPKPKPDA